MIGRAWLCDANRQPQWPVLPCGYSLCRCTPPPLLAYSMLSWAVHAACMPVRGGVGSLQVLLGSVVASRAPCGGFVGGCTSRGLHLQPHASLLQPWRLWGSCAFLHAHLLDP